MFSYPSGAIRSIEHFLGDRFPDSRHFFEQLNQIFDVSVLTDLQKPVVKVAGEVQAGLDLQTPVAAHQLWDTANNFFMKTLEQHLKQFH